MLTYIHIRDLATIEELHLTLQTACTMITGETGAGKSIFIEAIELALGERASANVVRPGKEKAEISLAFDITHFPKVIESLKNVDLYTENTECIIRRVITHDGRSRAYVNGAPVNLHYVKELGELLFHLHGQYEQQVLLKNDTQREMLDRYGDHLTLATELKKCAQTLKTLQQEIKIIQEKSAQRVARTDYLNFQLEELHTLKLSEHEWKTLETEHHKLTHAEELIKNLQNITLQLSDNDENLISTLHDVRKILDSLRSIEPKTNVWINNIDHALIHITDLDSELNTYLENTDLDPEKLNRVEERVSQIFNLSRKHKIQPPELYNFQQQLEKELQNLNASDENLAQLEYQQNELKLTYKKLTQELSLARKKAAQTLQQEITKTIRALSLPHGEFTINFENLDENEFSVHGQEKIIFLIRTNPDQTPQALAKVISGGELSRLSLALHLALANRTNIPTLIFDEIDTGVSGGTAEKIGKLLRKLGESYQVFCVTHQPQVAACGQSHLFVEKYFVKDSTYTRLRLLNLEERTREIARMLGGEKITQKTLEHAKEVLALI